MRTHRTFQKTRRSPLDVSREQIHLFKTMKTAFAFLLLAARPRPSSRRPRRRCPCARPRPRRRWFDASAAYAIAASRSSSRSRPRRDEGTGEPFGYDNIAQVVCRYARAARARLGPAPPARPPLLAPAPERAFLFRSGRRRARHCHHVEAVGEHAARQRHGLLRRVRPAPRVNPLPACAVGRQCEQGRTLRGRARSLSRAPRPRTPPRAVFAAP